MSRSRKDLYRLKCIYSFCSYVSNLLISSERHIWHNALLKRYSMRLQLSRVCNLNDFLQVKQLFKYIFYLYNCFLKIATYLFIKKLYYLRKHSTKLISFKSYIIYIKNIQP